MTNLIIFVVCNTIFALMLSLSLYGARQAIENRQQFSAAEYYVSSAWLVIWTVIFATMHIITLAPFAILFGAIYYINEGVKRWPYKFGLPLLLLTAIGGLVLIHYFLFYN